MAGVTSKESRRKKRNADTNVILTSLNGGALTFGKLLASLRQADEAGLAQFAAMFGIWRRTGRDTNPTLFNRAKSQRRRVLKENLSQSRAERCST